MTKYVNTLLINYKNWIETYKELYEYKKDKFSLERIKYYEGKVKEVENGHSLR